MSRDLVLKIAVILNAIVLGAAFVGCPGRKQEIIGPRIAACPADFHRQASTSDDATTSQVSKDDKQPK